jgi:hypothetical protein
MITGARLAQRYHEEIRAVEDERAKLQQLRKVSKDNHNAINQQLQTAWQDAASALLPTVDAARLQELSTALGIGDLHPSAVAAAGQQALQDAQATVQRIETDDRHRRREELEASIQIRQAELGDAAEALRASVQQRQQHDRFQQLIRTGYDTDSYGIKWWQMQFYDDWRDADAIVAELGQGSTFDQLRVSYERDRDGLLELERGLAEESGRLQQMATMASELAAAQQLLADPTVAMRNHSQAILRTRIEEIGADAAAAMMGPHGAVLARVSALTAKKTYLGQLDGELLHGTEQQAIALQDKLVREAAKLSNAKNAHRSFPDGEMNRRFAKDRVGRLRMMRQRAHDSRDRIYTFDRYDRYNPVETFLWWDVMSDGQLDGNFLREVRDRPSDHHDHHDHSDRSLTMDAS